MIAQLVFGKGIKGANIGLGVAFIQRQHQRAPFTRNQVSNLRVLLIKGAANIHQQHHHFGKAHGAQRISNRKFLQLFVHPRFAANAGGIPQHNRAVMPLPIHGDAIAGDACLRSCKQAVFF